jgi:hypothetical protein
MAGFDDKQGYLDAINFGGTVRGALVKFYHKSVLDRAESIRQKLRINKDEIYIQIMRPGEPGNVVDRPIEEQDKNTFRREWEMFSMNRAQIPDGTPIDILFPNNPSVADNMRNMGIHTIQMLADFTAYGIDNIGMGGQDYVNKAKAFIKHASSGKAALEMQETLRENQKVIAELKKENLDLQAQLKGILHRLADPTNPTGSNVNPHTGVINVPFIEGYDPQTERINANHPTSEIAAEAIKEKSKFGKKEKGAVA